MDYSVRNLSATMWPFIMQNSWAGQTLVRKSNGELWTISQGGVTGLNLVTAFSITGGKSWANGPNLPANPRPDPNGMSITVDPWDNIHCVAMFYDGGGRDLHYSMLANGAAAWTAWALVSAIVPGGVAEYAPTVLIDGLNQLHMAYGSGANVCYRPSTPTPAPVWGAEEIVIAGAGLGPWKQHRVALSPAGEPACLCNTMLPALPEEGVYFARRVAGVWAAPEVVHYPAGTPTTVDGCYDLAGNFHAAYLVNNVMYYRMRDAAGVWFPAELVPVTVQFPGMGIPASLITDLQGGLYLFYADQNLMLVPGNIRCCAKYRVNQPWSDFLVTDCGSAIIQWGGSLRGFWPQINGIRTQMWDRMGPAIFPWADNENDWWTLRYENCSHLGSNDWPIPAMPARSVTTLDATGIAEDRATLNGRLMEDLGTPCDVYFEYGLTTAYGMRTPVQTSRYKGGYFEATIGPLASGQAFHYRAVAGARGDKVYGTDKVLSTLSPCHIMSLFDPSMLQSGGL